MTDGAAAAPAHPPGTRAARERGPRRLRRRPDFLAAARGRRFHTERITVQARAREVGERRDGGPAEGLYLGLTITKRVGHATERNRIRRRLRRAVEQAALDLASPSADVVVIARRPCLDAPFAALVADLRRALDVVTKPQRARPKPGADAPQADGSGARTAGTAHVSGPAAPGGKKRQHPRGTAPAKQAPGTE